ncbi:hypothetical protein Plim_0828 [Planctopirus limnophila DSM 3776]|uniref:Uncharacterized protein n=1 Tax=Planctopirus limnophila (strain ATCC 43296 / DSM 3776 / IFAM 1008 / Mu 290) TaxID=521674 RepID=D5SSC5_PLAL2|nr:hypothetical protein Plim_0828 [Planctopirus limnophila DSM 3776]
MYLGLKQWLPSNVTAADLEDSIQFLGQVLALVVGVLLIGTTVSLTSYDGSDILSTLYTEITTSVSTFFSKFFASGPTRHKLKSSKYRLRTLQRPGVATLLFKQYDPRETNNGWYVYRPEWDGAWYQISHSPFSHHNHTGVQLEQIRFLHEAVICANCVLRAVDKLRSSGGAIVEYGYGTNGSIWFLESFEKYKSSGHLEIPQELSLNEAVSKIKLALDSEHYLQEELREHARNVLWAPFVLTTFQLEYIDYVKSLTHLVEKLQLLRWANIRAKFPQVCEIQEQRIVDFLGINNFLKVRMALYSLRAKVVTAHGATSYFHQVKSWSIPGIGVSLIVLLGLLCGWPYLKWAADHPTRDEGFVILYAAAISAMCESSIFLVRLLWSRRLGY